MILRSNMNSFKIICLSIFFFLVQIFLVAFFVNDLHVFNVGFLRKYLGPVLLQGQKYSFNAAQNALSSNKFSGFKIFWVGGSTAHNYFELKDVDFYNQNSNCHIYDLSFPTQSMYDLLRLLDNIEGPGALVIGLHPAKLIAHTEQQIIKGYNKTGQQYLVFLPSKAADALYHEKDWGSVTPLYNKLFVLNPELGIARQALDALPSIINSQIKILRKTVQKNSGVANLKSERFEDLPGLDYISRLDNFKRYKKSLGKNTIDKITRNLYLFQRIYELAKTKRIDIFLFEHPVSTIYREELADYVSLYEKMLQIYLSDYQEVQFHSFNWKNYEGDDYLFEDGMHLSEQGKKVFSPMLREYFYKIVSSEICE